MKTSKTIILGRFNTIHLGHQKLVNYANNNFTNFDLMRIKDDKYILTNLEIKYLSNKKGWSLNNIIAFDFLEIKSWSVNKFINYLKEQNYQNIICGKDFKFGCGRQGSISDLKKIFNVIDIDIAKINGKKISTTEIKSKLVLGELEYFELMHGFKYFVYNKIIHGDEIGRTINFPTINQDVDNKILPKFGVYNSNVVIDGADFKGANYIGRRPTTNAMQLRFETNLINFNDFVYDKYACVELISNIRGEMKFSSVNDLKLQIQIDVNCVKGIK